MNKFFLLFSCLLCHCNEAMKGKTDNEIVCLRISTKSPVFDFSDLNWPKLVKYDSSRTKIFFIKIRKYIKNIITGMK